MSLNPMLDLKSLRRLALNSVCKLSPSSIPANMSNIAKTPSLTAIIISNHPILQKSLHYTFSCPLPFPVENDPSKGHKELFLNRCLPSHIRQPIQSPGAGLRKHRRFWRIAHKRHDYQMAF